jgi:hypothetical protein
LAEAPDGEVLLLAVRFALCVLYAERTAEFDVLLAGPNWDDRMGADRSATLLKCLWARESFLNMRESASHKEEFEAKLDDVPERLRPAIRDGGSTLGGFLDSCLRMAPADRNGTKWGPTAVAKLLAGCLDEVLPFL